MDAFSRGSGPVHSATCLKVGASARGKKLILANRRLFQLTKGEPKNADAPCETVRGRRLERSAAREIDELGLVVLALRDRHGKVKSNGPQRRRP